jgi:hypothetical protein
VVVQADANHEVTVDMLRHRSPALNVCNYALWAEIRRRMRAIEAKWTSGRTESHKQFPARLRRTEMALPQSFVDASIGGMKRRCKRLYEAGAAISKTATSASVRRPRCHPNRVVGCARPCAQFVKM